MKIVVQRVKNAKLEVEGKLISQIGTGLVCFVGFGEGDQNLKLDWYVNKLCGLRIFEDENQKMNLNLTQVDGEILLVSNFTLYADCSHGFRPSFINALNPHDANNLFEKFVDMVKTQLPNKVKTGVFGADMQITQHNDGPITIILDSEKENKWALKWTLFGSF